MFSFFQEKLHNWNLSHNLGGTDFSPSKKKGSIFDGDTCSWKIIPDNNHGDRFRPLRIGLWDPFQMAFLLAYKWGWSNHHLPSGMIRKANVHDIGPKISCSIGRKYIDSWKWWSIFQPSAFVRWGYPKIYQKVDLVGGWTNPSEKYARQIGLRA